jgi:hypothetical protein
MATYYDPTARFGSSLKASSRRPQPGGLSLGQVTRDTGGIFVEVPQVAPGQTFGPCAVFGPYPKTGDTVLCAFLDNKFDEIVVLGKASTSKVLKDVATPVENTDASNKLYVDNEIASTETYTDNQIASLLSYVNGQLATKANI